MTIRVFVLPILLWKHPKDEKPRPIAIVNRGTLYKSSLATEYEGKLKLFGGLVEKGESVTAALQREVNEELPNLTPYIDDFLLCQKQSYGDPNKAFAGSFFETFNILESPNPLQVRILHLLVNDYVHTTEDLYDLIAGCAEGNAEFYDILNRPFNSEDWVPFLSVLHSKFFSYRLEHS
jgi:hypothetical protein